MTRFPTVAHPYFCLLPFALCLLTFLGCGYRVAGRGDRLPPGVKTIAVPVFTNSTRQFKIEQRVSATDVIAEGLYVYAPAAFGPQCGTARLVLYSEKEPEKADSRTIDPKVIQQIWQDFILPPGR